MSPLKTNLYLDNIDLKRYCLKNTTTPPEEAEDQTCLDDCPFLTSRQIQACKLAIGARTYLPSGPPIIVPQPIESDLIPLNEPDKNSMVIVSGNSRVTFEVLTAVWSQGFTPAYLLLIDCLGHTVDMAMVFGEFTPQRLKRALEKTGIERKLAHRRMIVPGLASILAVDFAKTTGWEVVVGPVCAAELPLFLGDRWVFSG
ncbi:MAG: hypothetical protein WC560_01240 [Syntrophales bacterium]